MILSLRDATSIPWQVVRVAWANLMHELEQGNLRWGGNATQWVLNKLSTSQIAMANSSHLNSQKQQKGFENTTMTILVPMKETMVNSNMYVHFVHGMVNHMPTQRQVAILKPEVGTGIFPDRTDLYLDTEHGEWTLGITRGWAEGTVKLLVILIAQF